MVQIGFLVSLFTNMRINDYLPVYGSDIDLFLDFTRDLRTATGPKVVVNDIVGVLLDDWWYAPGHCVNLVERLRRSDPRTYKGIATEVENAILKDDRIDFCTCSIEGPNDSGIVNVLINVVLARGESFELVGSLDSFSVNSDFNFLTRQV